MDILNTLSANWCFSSYALKNSFKLSASMRSNIRRASSSVAGTTLRSLNPFFIALASGRTVKEKWKVFDTYTHIKRTEQTKLITIFNNLGSCKTKKSNWVMVMYCLKCRSVKTNLTSTQLGSCNMSNNFNVNKWLIWIVNLRVQNTRFETQKVPYINLFKDSFYDK